MNLFDKYFDWLIPWEGEVFEDDPDDPGGATKYGIDQRSHSEINIRSLTKDQAKAIYLKDYWNAVQADQLSPQVAVVVSDIGVNNGKSRAIKWLQSILGVAQDGIIGPKTIAAARHYPDGQKDLAYHLLARRNDFYHEIAKGKMAKYLKGWMNRNNSLRELVNTL